MTHPSEDPAEKPGERVVEPLVVFAIALAARLPFLDHIPHKDELNHVLAARSLLERGTLEVAAGGVPYERAWGFTHLVARMFQIFGESLMVARVPALLAGAGLSVAVFLWVRQESDRIGAWIAALLITFAPISLMLSQWVRFYTIHALLFFAACALTYRALPAAGIRARRRALLLFVAAMFLLAALHLQVTTLVGIAGLGAWIILDVAFRLWRRAAPSRQPLRAAALILLLLAVALSGIAILRLTALGEWALVMAGTTDLWAEENADAIRFYHDHFLALYPTLWTLFPAAILVAGARYPRPTLLCACVFGVAFVSHSLLAWKAERYIFHALPMFFAIWGLAASASVPWLRLQVLRIAQAATGRPLSPRVRDPVVAVVLLSIVVFAAPGNAANAYAVKMMTVGDAAWGDWGGYRGNPDYAAAGAALQAEVNETDVLLASSDVSALHGLGRLDYVLRRETGPGGDLPDFAISGKSNRPVVSTPQALRLVMACHESGLAIIERTHYRRDWAVTPALVEVLDANAREVDLPEAWRLWVYRWSRPLEGGEADCAQFRHETAIAPS